MYEISSIDSFLSEWDDEYAAQVQKLRLFDPKWTSNWTPDQRAEFANVFQHVRGHFHEFLWHLGSFAPTFDYKQVVLNNLAEEFGGRRSSHEQLYRRFALAMGGKPEQAASEGLGDLPFVSNFNAKHLQWLRNHEWDHQWAAFSAYERLDNIDYINLFKLAQSLGAESDELTFFEVHRGANHFEAAGPLLLELWNRNSQAVRAGFDFIGSLQRQVWTDLDAHLSSLHTLQPA